MMMTLVPRDGPRKPLRWRHLAHDRTAEHGSDAFEPAWETPAPHVADDVPERITPFHVTGGYTYVDPSGRAIGREDVFARIDTCRKHDADIGLGADDVQRFYAESSKNDA